MTLDEVEYFSKIHKHGRTYKPCPIKTITKYSGVLPALLTDSWGTSGFQVFSGGFLWSVDPDEYRSCVAEFLHGYQSADAHAMFRTGFGDMVFYYRGKIYHLSAVTLRHAEIGGSLEAVLKLDLGQRASLDAVFFFNLFKKARRSLGELTEEEVYGFFPALPLGGEPIVNNLRRVNLKAHLKFLSQL